jgi:magnesium chelatase subunit H
MRGESNLILILLCNFSFYSWGWSAPQRTALFAISSAESSVNNIVETNLVLEEENEKSTNNNDSTPKIVLVAGFESFNRQLYQQAAENVLDMELIVFSDREIRTVSGEPNPEFISAVRNANVFLGSLLFDYDDVQVVQNVLSDVPIRLIFESATELMQFNQMGTFNMMSPKGLDQKSTPAGPPPAVKAILSKFSSGKEEDKLNGYLQLLKVGPDLLKFVPGTGDLRTWLEAYRYWNQGGVQNVSSLLQLLVQRCRPQAQVSTDLPRVVITPDVGLVHPLRPNFYWTSPKEYLNWRLSLLSHDSPLRQSTTPRVAILLYRKHVITGLRYISDLIQQMESLNILPIPIFINGVEAHTIVRELLTSTSKDRGVQTGRIAIEPTFQPRNAVRVDAIVNTIGFPLVGGPAGSMQAGRNIDVAQKLLTEMNIPYLVAAPLLLQTIPQWKKNGVLGLQSVVLYSLPELDGAIDTVVLGGLVGDKIALVPERVRKLAGRLKGWTSLRNTPPSDRTLSIVLYGFPPNVGAVGTAALLDVPKSLENLLRRLHKEGYNVGSFATDPDACGESLVAALSVLCESSVISKGASSASQAVQQKLERASRGDPTTAACLARPGGGLGGAIVEAIDMTRDELDQYLGRYMATRVRRSWSEKERGPGVSSSNKLVVSGLKLGNIFVTVQPLLGVEGDPMRLLFERDLTPHPQYCAAYSYMKQHSQAVLHFGMHGTVEWLPGQPLGNDRSSWSDELLGNLPNIYLYAVNNPSESILAKRRGYGTLVSYNVPPYGRAGLYLELANLKDLIDEYRMAEDNSDLRDSILSLAQRCGITSDVPLLTSDRSPVEVEAVSSLSLNEFDNWVTSLSSYMLELQSRLFSSGLHALGSQTSEDDIRAYLTAYFGDKISEGDIEDVLQKFRLANKKRDVNSDWQSDVLAWFASFVQLFKLNDQDKSDDSHLPSSSALRVASLLHRSSSEELDAIITALDGGYVAANPGGDLLRDGEAVLPTGRNIYALDPYRMPSAGAWIRGKKAAQEILRQHCEANNGAYPETVAVTLWGLDAIKTQGESVAIVLALVGAMPTQEGTGRIVRFDLIPIEELGRPRIDVLASLSGIFRDSFANIVDLLDDMFERAAVADEPDEMNFIKKHASSLQQQGVERPAARLFSNPPGDYGSMVNEVVGSGEWEEADSLGETWKNRNAFSYGRNEGEAGSLSGTARPKVLDLLLTTTERVVQEVDSVEYGLTDIQEYYANTGALKKAAENRKPMDAKTGRRKKVDISVIEAFGNDSGDRVPVRNVEDVLRMEYRSKLLNPKWRDAMLAQGSGGAFEVSQRMTAMVGWGAVSEVDNFVFDQAAERYALDTEVARQLQKSNPEAFKNVLRRLLEANGRGMWKTDESILNQLREMYAEADDMVEQVIR